MRPTTKDLAKAAGVSLATVDRVLNERANVSEQAVRKVHEAIERIGFVRNSAMLDWPQKTVVRSPFVTPEHVGCRAPLMSERKAIATARFLTKRSLWNMSCMLMTS